MTQLQTILLETFKNLLIFFEENNISYFTCGGTTLGAVRHKGFIPWDDDIDVYVPRKDYDRMIELRHNVDESKYKLMCILDEPFPYPYARFYNQEWKIESTIDALIHQGPFVDIIPLDEADDDLAHTKELESKYMDNAKAYRRCLHHFSWKEILTEIVHFRIIRAFGWIRRKFYYSFDKREKYLRDFLKAEEEIRGISGKFNFCYFHTYAIEKELFPKEYFSEYVECQFESIMVRVPKMYHEYLSQLFGDYMQLPPVEKRKVHYDNDKCLTKIK